MNIEKLYKKLNKRFENCHLVIEGNKMVLYIDNKPQVKEFINDK